MGFTNKSTILAGIPLPSQTLYSTLCIDHDSLETVNTMEYEKICFVSKDVSHQELSGFDWKFSVNGSTFCLHVYEKPNLICDTSFVIQGPLHEHTVFTVLYAAPYGTICLGIWEDDFKDIKAHAEETNVDNYYNKYFQIVSTLKGLVHVKTPYVVKLRADEYFLNFIPFLTKLKSFPPHQILTSNIYFKKADNWPYHISDHIIGGKREYIISMFLSALQNCQTKSLLGITPEVHLAVSYLQQFGEVHPQDRNILKIIPLMHLFFDLFPVRLFEDYKMKGPTFLVKSEGQVDGVNTLEVMSDFTVQLQ
jgi:hypothetical protein